STKDGFSSFSSSFENCFFPPIIPNQVRVSTCLVGKCCQTPYTRNPVSQECDIACPIPTQNVEDYNTSLILTGFILFWIDKK
ncbi:MAG TPA: hypothetical protein PK230_02655, partial [Chitinophagales bacterium]|nr:hypothetical protein [Chitinophagales bacterium]